MPEQFITEAKNDSDKQAIIKYMESIKANNADREEKFRFWSKYLIENHADRHPDWTADKCIRQVALCDFVKRLKPWFMEC